MHLCVKLLCVCCPQKLSCLEDVKMVTLATPEQFLMQKSSSAFAHTISLKGKVIDQNISEMHKSLLLHLSQRFLVHYPHVSMWDIWIFVTHSCKLKQLQLLNCVCVWKIPMNEDVFMQRYSQTCNLKCMISALTHEFMWVWECAPYSLQK